MKTYAPKDLAGTDLRALLDDLHATPAQVAKFLKVTERSIWRWLADGSSPFAVLAALWHETPSGRETVSCDVGNELMIYRGLASGRAQSLAAESARLAYLVSVGDFGAANDPLMVGPASKKPQLPRLFTLSAPGGLGQSGETPPPIPPRIDGEGFGGFGLA